MNESLILKRFTKEDIDLLFKWVNEEETRKNSFDSSFVRYEEHIKWCYDKLLSEAEDIFIVYLENSPVAQLRLRYVKDEALISYSIDSDYRGRGLGYRVIEMIESKHIYRDTCKKLIGKVKKGNIASQKIFERCEYEKNLEANCLVYKKKI